jgi:hypothetical protein
MKKLSLLLVTLLSSGFVFAKLPAPTPEQAAAADLAKARADHGNRVANYQLCMSINDVANKYKKAGTPAPGACTNPGPFVAPAAAPAAAAPAAPAAKK